MTHIISEVLKIAMMVVSLHPDLIGAGSKAIIEVKGHVVSEEAASCRTARDRCVKEHSRLPEASVVVRSLKDATAADEA